MALQILIDCFVRNNACSNYSSSNLVIFNQNIVPFLFFAADFNLFSCVFVGLTLSF